MTGALECQCVLGFSGEDLQEKLSLAWLEGKLTASQSSLHRRSYHRSSDLMTNYTKKFSTYQGKYIEVYTLSLT